MPKDLPTVQKTSKSMIFHVEELAVVDVEAAERRGVGDPAAGVTRASEAERGAQHL